MIRRLATPWLTESLNMQKGCHVLARRGGLIIWMLPALAAVALAVIWLAVPGQDRPASDADVPSPKSVPSNSPGPHQGVPQPTSRPSAAEPQPKSASLGDNGGSRSQPENTSTGMERMVVGEWTGFYQGDRRLTVRNDGTATMVVEPEGLASMLLASKLTFEVRWKINGDQLEFETVGGVPLDKVNVVVKMYGKRRTHKILSLNSDKMLLLDEDGVTEYVWTPVSPASDTPQGESN